ncbi:Protein AATF [Nymphon striatum]|nr:Protein AATF [Nymphon striatum]
MASLSEELAKLVDPTPLFNDPEDEENIESSAKLIEKDEFEDDFDDDIVTSSSLRSRNAEILGNSDKVYAGKVVSRKDLFSEEEDLEESGDESEGSEDDINQFKNLLSKQNKPLNKSNDEQVNDQHSDDKLMDSVNNDYEKMNFDDYDEENVDSNDSDDSDDSDDSNDSDDVMEEDGSGNDKYVSEDEESSEDDKSDSESANFQNFTKTNINEEIEKGKAVKAQLALWDGVLRSRIKIQNLITLSNQLPQNDTFNGFLENGNELLKSSIVDSQKEIRNLMDNLINLQNQLLLQNSVTKSLVDEEDLNVQQCTDNEAENTNTKTESKKRKIKATYYEHFLSKRFKNLTAFRNSDNSDVDYEPMESDNETIDSYECDDVDLSEHEDDGVMPSDSWKRIADIFSDCRPNSLLELVHNFSGVNPALNCNANNSVLDCFKKFITNDVIDYLVKNETIQKWSEKTRVASGKVSHKSFAAFEQSTLKQINQKLSDKFGLIKKTQRKQSDFRVLGKPENEIDEVHESTLEAETYESKVQQNYDTEIFDDTDFYHQLLREVLERKSSVGNNSASCGRQLLEIQKLRSKIKKKVDTKASKGRKIRYTALKKLVNFMAPIVNHQMADEAKNELFSSLFGIKGQHENESNDGRVVSKEEVSHLNREDTNSVSKYYVNEEGRKGLIDPGSDFAHTSQLLFNLYDHAFLSESNADWLRRENTLFIRYDANGGPA